ncbi:hypothetical protein [Haladaptatus sp. DFWS20]|uniref:hypothetical protein n=1 Tax=Haladaptatus sp. DFWS20 TaxID=3403467 RepID=UPI003EBD5719
MTGTAVEDANHTIEYLNREHVADNRPKYEFKRGNALSGRDHSLVRNFAGNRYRTGFIIETTRHETTLEFSKRLTVPRTASEHATVHRPRSRGPDDSRFFVR